MSEEDLEVGRLIGGAARRSPEVAARLKELRKLTKKKSSDILAEALDVYEMYMLMRDIDPKSFAAALSFFNYMLKTSVGLVAQLIPILSSEFINSYLSSVQQFLSEKSEEEKGSPDISESIKAMVATQLLNILSSALRIPAPTQPISTPKSKPIIEE
ncbi:hypothetical protein ATG_13120 [Desulfurococcaceae archaeon AG1]|nr:hypothetical protein ATG_13120 [Desulfurococcaceae archaeon AG1]